MRKYKLLFVVLICFNANAQLLVHDPISNISRIQNTLHNIKSYVQQIKDYQELLSQSKFLLKAFDEDGLWATTFKGLIDIFKTIKDIKFMVDDVKAFDIYDIVPYIPTNGNSWYEDIEFVLFASHGILPDEDMDALIDLIGVFDPRTRDQLDQFQRKMKSKKKNLLNSMFFISSRKEEKQLRKSIIKEHQGRISGFDDMSAGESANLNNAQQLLISQQNEEILNALEHMILTSKTKEFESLKEQEYYVEYLLRRAEMINGFDKEKFYRRVSFRR